MWLISVLVGILIFVYPIPDLVFHHFQWGAFHASERRRQVALTFDDGPTEDTMEILDILASAGVKATFFMVSERAANHPEWVRRVVEQGHEIGLHGQRHRSAYTMTPWQTAASLRRGVAQLEAVSGTRVRWYRPPWGHHNLWTWWTARRLGLERVLWTVAPNDWNPRNAPERIVQHVAQAALAGGVVVLHDGGGDRTRTKAALPVMIERLRRAALEFTTVGSLERDPSWLKMIWRWWEARFQIAWDIDPVPSSKETVPIFRLGKVRYRGKEMLLGRTALHPGQWFGEIHFDNGVLSQFSDDSRHSLKAFHAVRRSLIDLASFVTESEKYQDVAGFGGVTVLDAGQAIERLGFHRRPVVGWQRLSMSVYLAVLMAMYHRQGWRSIRRQRRLRPILLVMDRATLLERYGPDTARRASTQPRL